MFYGNSFIFNGIASERYNLSLYSRNGEGYDAPGSTNSNLITQTLYRRPKEYLLGVQSTPVLEFEVNAIAPTELDGDEIRAIQRWLFGIKSYKDLIIVQPDLDNIRYEAILINPSVYKIGNISRGVSFVVHNSSPWAYTFEKTKTFTIATSGRSLSFINTSDDAANYLYPTVSFTVGTYGGDCSLVNTTDANRSFAFTSLSAGETITIDNDLKIITSSTGLRRLGNFNKNWFRFLPGLNNFTVVGDIASISIKYIFARKII